MINRQRGLAAPVLELSHPHETVHWLTGWDGHRYYPRSIPFRLDETSGVWIPNLDRASYARAREVGDLHQFLGCILALNDQLDHRGKAA